MAQGTLVIIGGPTASGKTQAAAALAKHFGTEVISADSRQFYGAMRIGTARPDEEELLGVKHHFLGHLSLEETWSAGRFAREAEPVLQELLERKGVAVLVGGSGLYIDALVKGLDPLPLSDPRLRERLQQQLKHRGLPSLLAELATLDPVTLARIDQHNPHRVIRALEVCMLTGQPYSEQRTEAQYRTDIKLVRIAMDLPREQLYAAIEARVERMVAAGLVEEARTLRPHREHNALQTVGYRELFMHFDGELDQQQAIALVKQHTRNYAKRQMTWLRRDAWTWLPPNAHAQHIAHVEASI
ncbi:MAG TPA: tRNA (adenosine(37)-N6)-dimethylallyltransferase MiaA [Flavobacteriales bacterium]|nr:tRNA (adenosine(37)-N6)-dimethylallyltransferase MiaA [Flavobacteriales bacterium]